MMTVRCVALMLGLAGALAAQPQPGTFKVQPVDAYPSHQSIGKLKIAAVRYESDEATRAAFGKVNPNEYGVLPVLLVFENTSDGTLMLDRMKLAYQYPGTQVAPLAPADLAHLRSPKRPNTGPKVPSPIPLPKKKNPMAAVELQTRAFGARSLMKGESASGFYYFETRHHRNAVIYITGIREGITGKELFYAEVPLDPATPDQP